jgi:hypothetical protein
MIATRAAPSAPVASEPAAADQPAGSDNRTDTVLTWTVVDFQPVIFGGTVECVASGASCGVDGMLDTDTTALRAASLATALTEDLTRASSVPERAPGQQIGQLASRTAAAADALATELRRWLDSGCGSNLGGVPVVGRPADCGSWTDAVEQRLTELSDLLERWP